jgi:hypothetical protein
MNCFNAPQLSATIWGVAPQLANSPIDSCLVWSINRNSAIFSNANFGIIELIAVLGYGLAKVFLLSIFGGSDRCNLV